MRRIELWTAGGEYVATVEIPPFPDHAMPKVVTWGVRTFVCNKPYPDTAQPEKPWAFNECFAVASVTPSPGVERWEPPTPPPADWSARAVSGRSHEPAEPDTTVTASGQQKEYVVLTAAERSKGFVRPVRRSYKHVGAAGPNNALSDLTAEQAERYKAFGYAKYEAYPAGSEQSSVVGRFWTQAQLDAVGKGCGAVTTMAHDIAETYARSPSFYGATFCVGCGTHKPVGAGGEFVWEGTRERVGT